MAVCQTLTEAGIANADTLAEQAAEKFRRQCGGREVYVPVAKQDRVFRDRQIAAMYDGRNMRAVCRRFSVSRDTVYRAARRGE
jgi:Mor family transcriptional regulator